MPKIMIVEDMKGTYVVFSNWLKQTGYKVCPFLPSAEEALVELEQCAAEEALPDLAVLDIDLEGEMNGITLAGEIRERWPIPFIFLTDKQNLYDHTLHSGSIDFIPKPVDAETLEKKVRNLLEGIKRLKGFQEPPAEPSTAPSAEDSRFFTINKVNQLVRIRLRDLYYIESVGERSVRLVTAKGIHATALTLTKMLEKISADIADHDVVRVHKQYAINFDQCEALHGTSRNYALRFFDTEDEVPVGRTYEAEVKKRFQPDKEASATS